MPLATDSIGDLRRIDNCFIIIPTPGGGTELVGFNNLPEISDSKSVSYSDEPIIGRTMPLKTYSHSENRVISTKIDFFITNNSASNTVPGSPHYNLRKIRALQSACYPLNNQQGLGVPYAPPPVCKVSCGKILGEDALCVVMTNYSVSYPTDVAWDDVLMLPYKVTVDCSWHVVYNNAALPGQERILAEGR